MPIRRLTRSRTQGVIGGVCAGLADYFAVDVVLVRLLFVILSIAGAIIGGVIVYRRGLVHHAGRHRSSGASGRRPRAETFDDRQADRRRVWWHGGILRGRLHGGTTGVGHSLDLRWRHHRWRDRLRCSRGSSFRVQQRTGVDCGFRADRVTRAIAPLHGGHQHCGSLHEPTGGAHELCVACRRRSIGKPERILESNARVVASPGCHFDEVPRAVSEPVQQPRRP